MWRCDDPIGIIDWDMALPAEPSYDVLYALQYAAPFRDDETTLDFHHFPAVPDRKHRIKVFTEAYGINIDNITQKVANLQREGAKYLKSLAERGIQPQADWVESGNLEEIEEQTKWLENHKKLFE